MRRSKVLEKIRAGEVARICALGHYMPYFPKLAAHFGYDGIWVDGEHRAFDPREAQAFIAFHHLADIDCIWRTATLEKTAFPLDKIGSSLAGDFCFLQHRCRAVRILSNSRRPGCRRKNFDRRPNSPLLCDQRIALRLARFAHRCNFRCNHVHHFRRAECADLRLPH